MGKYNKIFILILVFVLFNVSPVFAYIDPASGSMLFSIVIGIVATVFFLFKSILYKIVFMLTGFNRNTDNNRYGIVLYNEGRKYWTSFKPLLDEFEKRKKEVVYYTSDEQDFVFNEKYNFIKSKYIGTGNKAYMKLSVLKADVCLMTTPGLDVYQLKKSKQVKHYCHIFHGIGDHCGYRLFGIDYYDSVMTTNEINGAYIRELEQKRGLKPKELVVAGELTLDTMSKKLKKLAIEKKDKFTVLLAPTWGPQAIFAKYGTELIDELTKMDCNIIIRPHPQSYISEKDLINTIKEKYKNNSDIIFDDNVNNLVSLNKADILISDFSGIIFDYAFLFNKPFIYTEYEDKREIYDYCDLSKPTWKKEVLNKIGFELTKENFKNINSIIKQVVNDKEKIKNIEEVKNKIWQKQGQAAKIIVDFLINKQKEITKC